ncbi:MAG: hypothetical protein ABW148_06870 [Sedimenticola sp.]
MKQILLGILLITTNLNVSATEIENGGWSSFNEISEIKSFWSFTIYKVEPSLGCGNAGAGWWKLDTSSTNETFDRALDYKKSILLAAYMSGHQVRLRCENGAISDFNVKK